MENQTSIFLSTAKVHHATRAKADKLAAMLAAEYPAISLGAEYTEDETAVTGYWANHVAADGTIEGLYEGDKVPDIATLLDACEDAGLDPEEGAEEPKVSGSVVPETYRKRYQSASSNGQTCGDWLAEFLVSETHTGGVFSHEAFTELLVSNNVDMTKRWAQLPVSGQQGWVGRYRMNGRQVLEKIVAKQGFVLDASGTRYDVPEAAMSILRDKHAKWLAKEAKRDAAATEVAEGANDAAA
jgi:hypothetical protein